MATSSTPLHESERLATLAAYEILDTPPERMFDDIARAASRVCGVPVAVVSLLDEHRQWAKAAFGMDPVDTPRDVALCSQVVLDGQTMVVPDARADARFADNPLVTGEPHLVFYAGAPLVAPDGHNIGALCVLDQRPHHLSDDQVQALNSLANLVVDGLEFRRMSKRLANALERVRTLESLLSMCTSCKKVRTEDQHWVPFEEYLHRQSGTKVSHGLCPSCAGAWSAQSG